MSKSTVIQSFFASPSKARTITIVVVVVLVLLVTLKYGRKVIARIRARRIQNQIDAEINAMGQAQSYTDSQYVSMANGLFIAMKGPGTNEPQIISIMSKLNNNVDVLKVKNAFGIRTYSYLVWSYELDLTGWLYKELSASYINEINNMLSAKSITQTF